MRGASPLLRRPFSRLSDVVGGALDLGAIGIFDANPGTDYVEPKGQILRVADYPDIGSVLPLLSGMIEHPSQPTFSMAGTGDQFCAGGRYALIGYQAYDRVYRSVDGGETFQVKSLGAGYIQSNVQPNVAMSPDGRYQLVASNYSLTDERAGSVSTDYGETWVGCALGQRSGACMGAFWLGPPHNKFAVAGNPNSDGSGWNTLDPVSRVVANLDWRVRSGSYLNGADCNPSTGTVVLALRPSYCSSVGADRMNGIERGGPFRGVLAGLFVLDVKFANGIWIAACDTGIYRSTDDAISWSLVAGSGSQPYYSVSYIDGKWLLTGPGARTVTFLSADGVQLSAVPNYVGSESIVGYYGGQRYSRIWQTDRMLINMMSKNNGPRLFRTSDVGTGSKFGIAPNLTSVGLVPPKKYYMRAK